MKNIFDNMDQSDMDLLVTLSEVSPEEDMEKLAQNLIIDKMKRECYLNGHPDSVIEGISKDGLSRKMYCFECNTFYEELILNK